MQRRLESHKPFGELLGTLSIVVGTIFLIVTIIA